MSKPLLETSKFDWLNIALILGSLAIAVYLPFKLFLFAYAFLGPLHYLTEINWLKQKNYFIKHQQKWMWPFLIVAFLVALYPLFSIVEFINSKGLRKALFDLVSEGNTLILFCFFLAIGLVFLKKVKQLWWLLIIAFLMAFSLDRLIPRFVLIFGIFLPTIFHVYLFTGLFMLYGSKKSKSKPGYLSVVVLFLVPFLLSLMEISPDQYALKGKTLENFQHSNMFSVSQTMAFLIGGMEKGTFYVLSVLGIKIQIFIAFAYTYHYLNWFSKTSLIGWKDALNARTSIWIIGVWLLAIALYVFDYKVGFSALFFLSFLHVFLEFPLNVITIKSLFRRETS